jgi:hypothetical protein
MHKDDESSQPLEWGQIIVCQGAISILELVIKMAEATQRWIRDPGVLLEQLTEDLEKLQEG